MIRTGGIDLYPRDATDWCDDYERSLDEVGLSYEWMDAGEAMRRWPQWRLDDDMRVMFQEASGIAAAATRERGAPAGGDRAGRHARRPRAGDVGRRRGR